MTTPIVHNDATILIGPLDISGLTSEANTPAEATRVDVTNFESGGWEEFLSGLKQGTIQIRGFRDEPTTGDSEPDQTIFANESGLPATLAPANPVVEGNRGVAMKTMRASYSVEESLGDAAKFSLDLGSETPLERGRFIAVEDSISGSGNSTGVQVGAIAAGQTLRAYLHVISYTGGGSLTVSLESDDNSGFTSATSQFSFAALTAIDSERKTLAGAVTDDFWRLAWTFTGTLVKLRGFISIQ